ncbi:MAG: matrixin family metalloprotease [Ignavibacteriaceae bacterium]
MKRFNHKISIVLLLVFFSLFLVDNTSAQKRSYENKKSKRYYSDTYHKSSSLKSSATTNDDSYKFNRNYNLNIRNKETNTRREIIQTRNDFNNTENYFHIDKSGNSLWDGKHWEYSRYPLNIYVKESNSRFYKPAYKDYIKYAMDVWRKAEDRIEYRFVESVNDADIALVFVENLGDEYEEDYLGLTDYETDRNKQIEFSKIQISLIKNGNERISAGEIKATIIHELGHAFGLGHSKNENDLMYPYISPDHNSEMNFDELSKGDKLAIEDLLDLSYDEEYVLK